MDNEQFIEENLKEYLAILLEKYSEGCSLATYIRDCMTNWNAMKELQDKEK